MQIAINIDVDDLEVGIAFYQAGLGLHLSRRLFDDSVAEMLGASSKIYLLEKNSGSTAIKNIPLHRDYHRHWTPVHLDFEVDDIAAATERAVAAGAKLEGNIQSFTWGSLATMSDPFGHGFCFLQFVGDGYGDGG